MCVHRSLPSYHTQIHVTMTTIKTKINSQPQRPLLVLPFIVTPSPCSQALNPGDHYSILSRSLSFQECERHLELVPFGLASHPEGCPRPGQMHVSTAALSLRRAGLRATGASPAEGAGMFPASGYCTQRCHKQVLRGR